MKRSYAAYDSIVGYDHTLLYNGLRYIDEYRTTKTNHRYFEFYDFTKGNVVYDGQAFNNLDLKYDLFNDVLIVKLKNDRSYFNLQLNNSKLSSFSINNNLFINFHQEYNIADFNFEGILKEIYNGQNLQLYSKYIKRKRDKLSREKVEYIFYREDTYLILLNKTFYKINSKNNLKKIFPNQTKIINDFYSNNKVLLEYDPETFIKNIIKELDKIETLN
ncbi:hypothetical protein [Bizionia arctica]|uniref:hypothetical protein n=1 Tax=Bizionia arctica TaxID=1495645 RepID=UPI0016689489|nr:hypothetical protein [Bizionia arctica]